MLWIQIFFVDANLDGYCIMCGFRNCHKNRNMSRFKQKVSLAWCPPIIAVRYTIGKQLWASITINQKITMVEELYSSIIIFGWVVSKIDECVSLIFFSPSLFSLKNVINLFYQDTIKYSVKNNIIIFVWYGSINQYDVVMYYKTIYRLFVSTI